ncbi:(-)-germacrene D synthase [Thalictrum thalictroides]|uniref:(-)-germacrene D synthase n=1 Tax=Thalictrum thalictroides TaxID=46969 RepID=A0A7J6VCX3_THATH|nr:(-)-germacrene D synthase [Thalictrum thalictroides]
MATKCACFISLTPMSMTSSKPDHMHRKLFSRLLSSRSSINPKFLNGTLKSSNIASCLPFDGTSEVAQQPGTGNFHPSVWDDHIFSSSTSNLKQDTFEELKKEVKSILSLASNDPVQELDLIDQIQRLGVAYHFEPEIEGALRRLYNDDIDQLLDSNIIDSISSEHLHAVSLRFRLLRQAGYYVSPDVFKNFKDKKGEFNSSLASDTRCMLSLYQASYLGFNGEHIMDEAMAFSTKHLKSMLVTQLNPALESEIQSALQIPLLKTMERVQAREYITNYKMQDSRNETLLKFATLDFNILQSLHQKEVTEVKWWWDNMNIKAKLPFEIRDRVVEGYCMLMATYFEPQYSSGRILLAKIYSMLSVLDDAFDVYGNLEELAPLTDAFQRWDGDVNYLTEHMRIIFEEVLNVVNGVEGERMMKGQRNGLPYLKEEVKDYTKGLLEEAKILFSGKVPTLEEWLPVSMVTVAINIFVIAAVMDLGEVATKEVFDWIASKPKMIRCSYLLNRLLDDIATFKGEQKRGILVSTVTCCMKDHGLSESNAIKYLQEIVTSSWKDMNEERFRPNLAPPSVTKIIFNITAIIELYYVGGVDGYTNSSGRTRDIVASLLVHPLPI